MLLPKMQSYPDSYRRDIVEAISRLTTEEMKILYLLLANKAAFNRHANCEINLQKLIPHFVYNLDLVVDCMNELATLISNEEWLLTIYPVGKITEDSWNDEREYNPNIPN